jgi:hypothetical protein
MTLKDLLGIGPLFHTSMGKPCTWQLADDTLRFIDEGITSESCTLETGEGMSTVVFANKKCRHFCVTPNKEAVVRIITFCAHHFIAIDGITFSTSQGGSGRSQEFLPLQNFPDLDLVLIDGGHEFPAPFIDWYYASSKLKIGGILVIDDTQLRTVHLLKEFLLGESRWRIIHDGAPRWAAFEKTAEGFSEAWSGQKFMAKWKP